MADIDALLAALEDGSDDPAEETKTPPAEGQSNEPNATIKAIREAQRQAAKDARDLAKALKEARAELDTYKTKEQAAALDAAFSGFELPEGVLALARKAYDGEATPEAVKQFLVDQKVLGSEASEETGGTTEDKSKGFQPGGTGQGGASSQSKITREEWLKLGSSDPKEAERLFLAGRVDLSDVEALKAHDQR